MDEETPYIVNRDTDLQIRCNNNPGVRLTGFAAFAVEQEMGPARCSQTNRLFQASVYSQQDSQWRRRVGRIAIGSVLRTCVSSEFALHWMAIHTMISKCQVNHGNVNSHLSIACRASEAIWSRLVALDFSTSTSDTVSVSCDSFVWEI